MKVYIHSAFLNPANLTAAARVAEAAGFDGMTVADHMIYPRVLNSGYPVPDAMWAPTDPWPDPWVTIGALAGATTTLKFATTIYIAPMRPVMQVAKSVSTAAVLSGNRVALGVGVGWMQEEFELVGQDFDTRGKRLDEQIEICRLLWSGGYQEYHGDFHDFPPVSMIPAPTEQIPIWVGGDAPVSLRRAARVGDGWIGMEYSLERAEELLGQLNTCRHEAGTADRDDFEIMMGLDHVPTADDIVHLEKLGVTALFVMPWESGAAIRQGDPGREALLRSIEEYGRTVLSAIA